MHKSAKDPIYDVKVNIEGTLNLLNNCVKYKSSKVIFASTAGVYGEQEYFPADEDHPKNPLFPYGIAKLAIEKYLHFYKSSYGLDYVILRYANVYGPRQNSLGEGGVVAIFTRKLLSREAAVINGDGKQTRDFLYIDDLVRAVMLCMEKDVDGETFQIASGMERTVGELAALLAEALARRGVKMLIEYASPRIGDVKRNYSDTSKASRILGWKVKTELEDGIEKTIDYFMQA